MKPVPLHEVVQRSSTFAPQVPRALTWSAVSLLFLIIHFPHDFVTGLVANLLDEIGNNQTLHGWLTHISGKYARSDRSELLLLVTHSVIVPLKQLGFLTSVVVLMLPVIGSIRKAHWIWNDGKLPERFLQAGIVFLGLTVLVFPRFLQSLGDEYGRMSLSPFTESPGLFHRRLLMPGVAHVIGASGYLFYFSFALLCTLALIFTVQLWFESKGIRCSRLFSFSLMTSSFVIYNFQFPGYPEQLAFVLMITCSIFPMTWQGRVAIVALALATHEATVFVLAPFIWFLFPTEERLRAMFVIALYALMMIVGHATTNFQFISSMMLRDERGWSVQHYLGENPLWAAAGAFFAYKILWLVPLSATYFALRNRDIRTATAIAAFVVLPFFMLPLALDASRLVGFGFMGVLLALLFLQTNNIITQREERLLAVLNLVVPSCYVGLNSGVNLLPGLYAVWNLLTSYL